MAKYVHKANKNRRPPAPLPLKHELIRLSYYLGKMNVWFTNLRFFEISLPITISFLSVILNIRAF